MRTAIDRRRFFVPAMLTFCAMLICLRMPQIIIKGRLWAEEGTVFFHNAWTMPPAQALLISYGGYLNLVANAAGLAARWLLPLRLAPYLTITVGLLFQLAPPLLLLTAHDGWLRPWPVRVAAPLLVLLVPGSEEIWLQTLHCQFQLALCCGIILALETTPGRGRLLRYALLLLAPLCGPVAIALLPLFIARALWDGARLRWWQAAALAAGAAVQLTLFFHPVAGRGYRLDPITLLDVVAVRHLYIPFLGIRETTTLAPPVQAWRQAGHVPLWATLLPIVVFAPLLFATLWHRRDRATRKRPGLWLLVAGGVLACVSYFGAIGGFAGLLAARGSDRYSFAPQALFALAVLAVAATAPPRIALVTSAAVLWLLCIGGAEYFQPWSVIRDGPPWRHEVAVWQADPSHRLLLWPTGPKWVISLEAR